MEPFTTHAGVAAPLLRTNIDTDAIIPSREMGAASKKGLADGLFANWRYRDPPARIEDPAFVLNQARYRGASVLLGGANFGCGSSREHAVWALSEYGVRCVAAPSFGAIFQGNCARNGLLPAVLSARDVQALAQELEAADRPEVAIDLTEQTLTGPTGTAYRFEIGAAEREMLLHALDAIAITLLQAPEIAAFEAGHHRARPWLSRAPRTSP